MISAFGVDHGDVVSKAVTPPNPNRSSGSASAGRMATASIAAPVHGLVAGRQGRKLAAGGTQLAGGVAGSAVGGALAGLASKGCLTRVGRGIGGLGGALGATEFGNRKGWYKPEKNN